MTVQNVPVAKSLDEAEWLFSKGKTLVLCHNARDEVLPYRAMFCVTAAEAKEFYAHRIDQDSSVNVQTGLRCRRTDPAG